MRWNGSGHRVSRVDVGRDIAAVLAGLKPDVALNMLHGRPGEDGTIQGLLEILGIPYSHSGVLASSVAMHKGFCQGLARGGRHSGSRGRGGEPVRGGQADICLPRPYVIKPVAEGSSVGVFIVTEAHEHPPQELYREDWAFGEEVVVERYIAGKELTCAVIKRRAERCDRDRAGGPLL